MTMEIILLACASILAIVAMVVGMMLMLYKPAVNNFVTSNLPTITGGATDIDRFNRLFVAANESLTKGNTDGLKEGIAYLIEALEVSGGYKRSLATAISYLVRALSHHDRADTKGPWNRDLSGYGVISWKNDLWDRDRALRASWDSIVQINNDLKSKGLGWKP